MPSSTHCLNGDKPLPPPPATGGRRYYCNKRCKQQAQNSYRRSRKLAEAALAGVGTCVICGGQLKGKQVYCSRQCQQAARAQGVKVERTYPERIVLSNGVIARIEVDEIVRNGKHERLPRPVWEVP